MVFFVGSRECGLVPCIAFIRSALDPVCKGMGQRLRRGVLDLVGPDPGLKLGSTKITALIGIPIGWPIMPVGPQDSCERLLVEASVQFDAHSFCRNVPAGDSRPPALAPLLQG